MSARTKRKNDTAREDLSAITLPPQQYVLRLYVTGSTARSLRAIENITRICEEYLENRYEIDVVDIYQQPALAAGEQIIAAPTLIKKLPLPLRRLVGDLSNEDQVLLGLDLRRTGGAGVD